MLDQQLQTKLLQFPEPDDPMFAATVQMLEGANFDELSLYLHWLTAETVYRFGAVPALGFLSKYASRRVYYERVLAYFEKDERFAVVLRNNMNGAGYVEVQSAAGFLECLRRYHAARHLSSGLTVQETAHLCGTSIRTVQRIRLKLR